MLLTIFTHLCNRAHFFDRIYDSLCQQTHKDFEWIIVNDGNSDNIKMVVEIINNSTQEGGHSLFLSKS